MLFSFSGEEGRRQIQQVHAGGPVRLMLWKGFLYFPGVAGQFIKGEKQLSPKGVIKRTLQLCCSIIKVHCTI